MLTRSIHSRRRTSWGDHRKNLVAEKQRGSRKTERQLGASVINQLFRQQV